MQGEEMLKERIFHAGGLAINYAEGPPSGPPLLLIHGGGDRWQYFLPIIPNLIMRWHICALDLRGHGRSGRVPGNYRPEHYVPDITAFLDSQISERVILFGHSLGGWIALLAAAERIDNIEALILGDPPLCMERFLALESSGERVELWRGIRDLAGSGLSVPELASGLADLPVFVPGQDTPVRYGDLPGIDAAHLNGWAKTLSQVDPDVAQYHAEGRLGEYVEKVNLDNLLRKMTCPVLLLGGDTTMGGVVSDSDMEFALTLLPDGLHVRLERAGHDLGLATGEVNSLLRAVTNFLESL
jgi:pimeloyl-ACP methyl ester carboxylesterase